VKKSMYRQMVIACSFGTVLAIAPARSQVTVDVSKITCEQYLAFSVADPRDLAIWLSGYYHGKQGSLVLDLQSLKEAAEKLKTACFQRSNSKLPVTQVITSIYRSEK